MLDIFSLSSTALIYSQWQMETGHVLKEAMAATLHRRKDSEDAQAALILLMKIKEEAIESAEAGIETKRKVFLAPLKGSRTY